MNIVLMSMPDVHVYNRGGAWQGPYLGIASLAAHLEGHNVVVADLIMRRRNVQRAVLKFLKKYHPQIVGLSAMTFQYHSARDIARLVRKVSPQTKIALGGYHATLMYEEIASGPDADAFDFIFRGEGELAFAEFVQAMEQGGSYSEIKGLTYLANGSFVHNPPRLLEDIESIRLPARHMREYIHYHFYFTRFDSLETSRGCLMNCNFCCMRNMYGKSFRTYSIDRVMEDIEIMARRKVKAIFFCDDNILLDPERYGEICDRIAARRFHNVKFLVQASVPGIARHPDLVRRMANSGVLAVFLGIENTSEKSLRVMKKGDILPMTEEAVRLLRENNMVCFAGLILGLPHDGEEEIRQNFECVNRMGITEVFDQVITPYPKLAITRELEQAGKIVKPKNFKLYNGYFANVSTDFLPAEQLQYQRWLIRRQVLGMWRPSSAFKHHYRVYSLFYRILVIPAIRLYEAILRKCIGDEGRYRQHMQIFKRMNTFNILDD
ncbi:MAG: radical SAM protein [Desulfatiglandales bacterium]